MQKSKVYILLFLALFSVWELHAQHVQIDGYVFDADTEKPIEFASVLLTESGQWAISNDKGKFSIKNVPVGKSTLTVQCLGYQKRTFPMILTRDVDDMRLRLKPENLKLDGVTVVAKRKQDEATTSYTIDRQTLDQQQILNISDIQTLLPGGKTTNPSLMNDNRTALRSNSQEKGNASFGTAIEVDGMRMDNNAAAGETMGTSTRTISASNIESVEVVTGIASVEYGDLSNGIVKINTRKGKSPFIIESMINQHTRQLSVNKGFDLSECSSKQKPMGVLNVSLEHAKSFSNAASPHTAYQRNVLNLHYMNVFMQEKNPLTLNIGITGNIGGYNSETDPDRNLDDYQKVRDNAIRGHFDLQWLLNKPWITNLWLNGSFSYSDRKTENYNNTNSATTLPYIHATEEGYYITHPYSSEKEGTSSSANWKDNPIILSPTGYWYVKSFHDSKPLNWQLKLKGEWTHRFHSMASRLAVGAQYSGSRNEGRGTYYDDMRYAPTWREYRYDQLPTMHNLAVYAEEKMVLPTAKYSTLELTLGLRDDITRISGTEYGTVSSLSPRANTRYVFWRNLRRRFVESLEVHAGWGKSVKLPSFQVLYPSPSYTDREAFAATSDATNTTYRAFHVHPSTALYNPSLRWQYTHQVDLGLEAIIQGTRINLSGFYHRTNRSYMSETSYTPFEYRYTPAVNSDAIAAGNRVYNINRLTGEVTLSDVTGAVAPEKLNSTLRRTYATTNMYVNSQSPIERYGLEWIIDFAQIKPLRTSFRLDGHYYYYKGIDEVLFADIPLGVNSYMSDGSLYQYVGYYRGSNVTSTNYSADAAVANGSLSKQLNMNLTITTHIPKIRMIVALRIESSLYHYHRSLSEFSDGPRGYMLENANDLTGVPYDGKSTDKYVIVYPEYYATWDNPSQLQPFAERFLWAKDNDPALYSDLSKLIVRSNYAYVMNPNRLSAYYSANLSVTKEIGDHVSLSFYANNFFRNLGMVHSSQTDLDTSLFSSSYIPNFYYGLSLRLKL